MFHPHLFIGQEHKLVSKTVVPNRLHCRYECLHLMCTLCNSPYNLHFVQRRAAHRVLWRARQRRKKGETTAESNLGDSANLPAPDFSSQCRILFCTHCIHPTILCPPYQPPLSSSFIYYCQFNIFYCSADCGPRLD